MQACIHIHKVTDIDHMNTQNFKLFQQHITSIISYIIPYTTLQEFHNRIAFEMRAVKSFEIHAFLMVSSDQQNRI